MIVGTRGPYLTQTRFGYQVLVALGVPEGTADSAGVGSPVEDGSQHFYLAGPGITMFADVAIEAQGAVVHSLAQTLLLQKMNGKNRSVSTVPAAQSQRPIF